MNQEKLHIPAFAGKRGGLQIHLSGQMQAPLWPGCRRCFSYPPNCSILVCSLQTGKFTYKEMIFLAGFWDMAKIQAALLVYLLVGVFIRKRGIISPQTQQELIDLLLRVLMPCMIFESFNRQLTPQELISASLMLGISFAICVFSMLLGRVLYRGVAPEQRSVLQYGTLITNAGFAGMPLVEAAYGGAGLLFASIFIIPNRIFMWSAGVSLFSQKKNLKQSLKVLAHPAMIAVYLGLARMLTGVTLPTFLDTALKSMGGCVSSLSMILVGAILADVPIRLVLDKRALYLSAVRLLLLPGLTLAALKLAGFDPMATAVAVTLTAMPVGTTTALLAERYGCDGLFGSKCVFMTTILSLITVPVLTLFL